MTALISMRNNPPWATAVSTGGHRDQDLRRTPKNVISRKVVTRFAPDYHVLP